MYVRPAEVVFNSFGELVENEEGVWDQDDRDVKSHKEKSYKAGLGGVARGDQVVEFAAIADKAETK